MAPCESVECVRTKIEPFLKILEHFENLAPTAQKHPFSASENAQKMTLPLGEKKILKMLQAVIQAGTLAQSSLE